MANATSGIMALLPLVALVLLVSITAIICRPRRDGQAAPARRWFFRNLWLLPPLLLALALALCTLTQGKGVRGYDNQIVLLGVAAPMGLAVVTTNLAHGKGGRKHAVLGVLLSLLACAVLLFLPDRLGPYKLTYRFMGDYMIGTMPVIVPAAALSALMVLVSGCIALFGGDQLPVVMAPLGKRLLRTLPLLASAIAVVMGWYFVISEYQSLRYYPEIYQMWACLVTLPVAFSCIFIDTAHHRGSKGAAVWGILCALAHAFVSMLMYIYYDGIVGLICQSLGVMSLAAALAEILCALMAMLMKRPALPAAPETAAEPAAVPAAENVPASDAVPATSVAAAHAAPAAAAEPVDAPIADNTEPADTPIADSTEPASAEPAAPVAAVDPSVAAMQEEISRLREQLAAKEAAAPATAAPAAPANAAPAAPAAAAPANQGIQPIVSYPYEPADLQPAEAPAIAPDLAEQIGKLTQLLNQGILDSAAYEAAVKRLTSNASGAAKTRPERIYEDFIRNHVAYAYKSPSGVTFEPLREDMICIEPIKLLTGLKYQDLTVRMIKTHLDAPNSYGTMLRQNVCIVIDDDFNPILVLNPQTGFGAVMNGVQTYTKLAGVKA